MSANLNHEYTIGTAARLSGFSTHQLRKWESRLGLLIPNRTHNGRRVYTVEQIQKLKMLRRLINTGYRIGDLAKIGEEQWYTLDPEVGDNPECGHLSVHVVGTMICAVLEANRKDVPNNMTLQLCKSRFSEASLKSVKDAHVFVAEITNVSENDAITLLEARKTGLDVMVIFKTCEHASLKELISKGIICLKAPVPPISLIKQLDVFFRSHRDRIKETIPQRRYSDAALSRVASASKTIKCECPKHLANLLTGISNLEEYALSCQTTSPGGQGLHEELRLVAAHARLLFEGALEKVAAAEGMDIIETIH